VNKDCGAILRIKKYPKHGGRPYGITFFSCGKCGVKRRARSFQHARQLRGAHQSRLPFLSHGLFLTTREIDAVWTPDGFDD